MKLIHFLLLSFSLLPLSAQPEKRPNVLIIAADDLNHWIGYTGRNKQTKTPNIDRLSARGVSFSNAHATVPVCNGSRASLLSGQRPFTTGVYGNADDWRKVIPPERTIISTFRKAGYLTLGSGKLYHRGYDRTSEWDDYLQNEGKLGPEPEGSKGVGGIRFGAIDADDSALSDHRIVDYGIGQLSKKASASCSPIPRRSGKATRSAPGCTTTIRSAPSIGATPATPMDRRSSTIIATIPMSGPISPVTENTRR